MILAGERLSPEEDVTGGGGWCKQGAAGLWCWRGVQAAPRPSYVSQPRLDQLLLGSGRATLLLCRNLKVHIGVQHMISCNLNSKTHCKVFVTLLDYVTLVFIVHIVAQCSTQCTLEQSLAHGIKRLVHWWWWSWWGTDGWQWPAREGLTTGRPSNASQYFTIMLLGGCRYVVFRSLWYTIMSSGRDISQKGFSCQLCQLLPSSFIPTSRHFWNLKLRD